jgi:uncharacterized membrane protein YdjX (TVP38/TMEM64 family)
MAKSNTENAKRFKIINKMFLTRGILFVALLRLMPVPFGLVSYLLGITVLALIDYMIGNCAYIVKIALYVFLGCTIY